MEDTRASTVMMQTTLEWKDPQKAAREDMAVQAEAARAPREEAEATLVTWAVAEARAPRGAVDATLEATLVTWAAMEARAPREEAEATLVT